MKDFGLEKGLETDEITLSIITKENFLGSANDI
jgi:hypothetical protein